MHAAPVMSLRRLEPHEARGVIEDVFGGLSDESRRLRFHTPMHRLPSYALDQLASVDDRSHVVVSAWIGRRAVGIGRFVRVGPGEAELAVEVVDAWQGRGIGRALLTELRDAAVELGYQTLAADVLPDNRRTLHLLRSVFPGARVCRSDGILRVTMMIGASRWRPRSGGCDDEAMSA